MGEIKFAIVQDGDFPIPEGEFDTREAAVDAMRELETRLGWRGLAVVERIYDGKFVRSGETTDSGVEMDER